MIAQSELYLYPQNSVAQAALDAFVSVCGKIYSPVDSVDIIGLNNELFQLISSLNLERLHITLTQSDSIYYKFKTKDSEFEFRWEIFHDYVLGDVDDIQSTLHVYKSGAKTGSFLGSTYETLEVILSTLKKSEKGYIEPSESTVEIICFEADQDNLFYVPYPSFT